MDFNLGLKNKIMQFLEKLKDKFTDKKIQDIIVDTEELVIYNEKIIAMENLLDNLYELNINLDEELLDMLKDILNNELFEQSERLKEWRKNII